MNPPRANLVFLRAYLLLALLVIVTGVALEKLLEQRDMQLTQQRELAMMHGHFLFAERELQGQGAQPAKLAALEAELAIPVALYSLEDFAALDPEASHKLEAGRLVLYNEADQAVFYRRLPGSDQVLALGPAPDNSNDRERWVVPLFFSLLAFAVFLWVLPLSRDLDQLQQAARSFGEQDFSARTAISPRSWLAPLGKAFNSMAQRIQWLLQSHRELTHAVSHELRTPLARLRFSLEMLSSPAGEADARHRAAMARDVEELNDLIEEMLRYAELDQDNVTAKLEPVHIGEWLQQYVSSYKTAGDGPCPTLQGRPENISLLMDIRMIERALDNLVGNARRYAKTEIQISAQVLGGHCLLHVVDDGPGIPPEKREAVLAAFSRLEGHKEVSGKAGGFGLGLAIAKRVMDLHGGELLIETAPSGGADMVLKWPAR